MSQFEVYGRVPGVGYVRMVVGATDSCAAAGIVSAMYGGNFELGYVKKVG